MMKYRKKNDIIKKTSGSEVIECSTKLLFLERPLLLPA